MTYFAKYQAMGNDYLVVETANGLRPGPEAARALCDRHFGLGADGVVFGPLTRPCAVNEVAVRLFNADGSICERSANGLRMIGLHLTGVSTAAWTIDAGFGASVVRVEDRNAGLVSIELGKPLIGAEACRALGLDARHRSGEPVLEIGARSLPITLVHNGNPHAVCFVDDLTEATVRELGPRIAGHPMFPDRVNAQFVGVTGSASLQVLTWERGAGYVMASGSGGCAAAAVAHHKRLVGRQVAVRMPGGQFDVRIDSAGVIEMSSTVHEVAFGTLSRRLATELAMLGSSS